MDTQTQNIENPSDINCNPTNTHFNQDSYQINSVDYVTSNISKNSSSVNKKPGLFKKVKNFFKRNKSQIELRRESKWRTIRKGTGDNTQKIEHFKEKVENQQIFDEIQQGVKEITINKTELIWLLDNIHSNNQIIKKLKRRQSQFDEVMEKTSDTFSGKSVKANKSNASVNSSGNSSGKSKQKDLQLNKLKVKQIMDRLQSQVEELENEKSELDFSKKRVE